jgi:cysteine-rich repeat protein
LAVAPHGTVTVTQVTGDCRTMICDGLGWLTTLDDAGDVLADNNPCTVDLCAGGMPVNNPAPPRSICAQGASTMCDGRGHCVQCLGGEDCPDRVCVENRCAAATCRDDVFNGLETDRDCGGPACPPCAPQKRCLQDRDCVGGACEGNRCLPSCTDSVRNGAESDLDCGGPSCPPCRDNHRCRVDTDCLSLRCSGTTGTCAPAACGDRAINRGEDCDDGNTVTEVCAYGVRSCQVCAWDCTQVEGATSYCGDGVRIPSLEECDDGNNAAEPCEYGDRSCTVCDADCRWRPGATTYCADGVLQEDQGEQCDDGNWDREPCAYGQRSCTVCAEDCWWRPGITSFCGDLRVNGPETCDDGNTVTESCAYGQKSCQVCNATCQTAAGATSFCGDGHHEPGREECDDGNTVTEPCPYGQHSCAVCAWDCTLQPGQTSWCGDDKRDPGEACDDGNTVAEPCDYGVLSCSVCGENCAWVPGATSTCGDGRWDTVREGCDDGNTVTEPCAYGTGSCTVCAEDCTEQPGITESCGDNEISAGEDCDDGNTVTEPCDYGQRSCEVCAANCRAHPGATTYCGDGVKQDALEVCDDGNTAGGDCCSAQCQVEDDCELEPNDTPALGLAAGRTVSLSSTLRGSISPRGDVDVIPLVLDAHVDLRITTWEGTPGVCPSADTFLTFLAPDGTTVLATDDDDGPNSCSAIDGARDDRGARRLVPGTYFVEVREYGDNGLVPLYGLSVAALSRCGDRHVESSEQCDDGNTLSGDGCTPTCTLEALLEVEPNGTCAEATAPVDVPPDRYLGGAIDPAGDRDWYGFTLTTHSDLAIEVFDGEGPGGCSGLDTMLDLVAADCATTLATDDDDGISFCSLLASSRDPALRRVPPGRYNVGVRLFSSSTTAPAYTLQVRVLSTCGNGVVEGTEECDGTPSCDATCDRIPVCNDGFIDAPENCEDGNTTNGDGCSESCQLEPGWVCTSDGRCIRVCGDGTPSGDEECDDGNLAVGDGCDSACMAEAVLSESEPNPAFDEADGLPPIPVPSTTVLGSINPVGDIDTFKFTLPGTSVVRLEVFDGTGTGCADLTTTMTLHDGLRALLYTSTNDGIGSCSALVVVLGTGSYYVRLRQTGDTATIPAYRLQVKVMRHLGDETEPNEALANATPMVGSDVFRWGDHQLSTDVDLYAVVVPPGRSLRVEVVEGSTETCESWGMDTRVTLLNASGNVLVVDDDGGRGICSRLDGTGTPPAHLAAHNLAGGTYYVMVDASWMILGWGEFDYRVVVTVR